MKINSKNTAIVLLVLAGVLIRQYGDNVSLIARGARGEHLRTNGLTLHSDAYGDFTAMPARLRILSADERQSVAEAEVREGKYHQVKRMFGAVGKRVLYLRRISMGPLRLDKSLAPGEFRELTAEEIQALRGLQMRGGEL